MTQAKHTQQDKIQEIMGLFYEACDASWDAGETSASRAMRDFNKMCEKRNAAMDAFESKLRELVREPLSDDEICTMLGIDGSDDWTYTVARAVERAHNITNTSGVE